MMSQSYQRDIKDQHPDSKKRKARAQRSTMSLLKDLGRRIWKTHLRRKRFSTYPLRPAGVRASERLL